MYMYHDIIEWYVLLVQLIHVLVADIHLSVGVKMCFCLLPANLAFVYVIQGYNASETSTTYTYWYIKPCIHANPRETKSGRGSRVCHLPPRKLFFRRTQNGAFCCILDMKSLNIVWKNHEKMEISILHTSQTSFPRTRMGRIPWMVRTYLKVPPIFHKFLS